MSECSFPITEFWINDRKLSDIDAIYCVQIENGYDIDFATTDPKKPDFAFLWRTREKMGRAELVRIRFTDRLGLEVDQNMYISKTNIKSVRYQSDDKMYTDKLTVRFIVDNCENNPA